MIVAEWEVYSPPWAPHVVGRYTKRRAGPDGEPEEQKVEAVCERCGETYGPRKCDSGLVRGHIVTFASLHRHRSGLAALPAAKR